MLMGDSGAEALASALASGAAPRLDTLDLQGNAIGDVGCFALARALLLSHCPCRPLYGFNQITPVGRAAVVGALESLHGGTSGGMSMLGSAGCGLPPGGLWRAWARGMRAAGEARAAVITLTPPTAAAPTAAPPTAV